MTSSTFEVAGWWKHHQNLELHDTVHTLNLRVNTIIVQNCMRMITPWNFKFVW